MFKRSEPKDFRIWPFKIWTNLERDIEVGGAAGDVSVYNIITIYDILCRYLSPPVELWRRGGTGTWQRYSGAIPIIYIYRGRGVDVEGKRGTSGESQPAHLALHMQSQSQPHSPSNHQLASSMSNDPVVSMQNVRTCEDFQRNNCITIRQSHVSRLTENPPSWTTEIRKIYMKIEILQTAWFYFKSSCSQNLIHFDEQNEDRIRALWI